jgi:TolB-like protein/thioredoxin-like negative regulator of GroEL
VNTGAVVTSAGDRDPFGLVGITLAGRFAIEACVAEGGFGVVYRALQVALARPVAIKILKPQASGGLGEGTFQDEARTVARLKHPSIVEVHDFGVSEGRASQPLRWMALEWLDGKTLERTLTERRACGERPLTPPEALDLLRPVLRAIGFAHRQGVAHRDLKPSNILLARLPEGVVPKVLDFGVAQMVAGAEGARPGTGGATTRSWHGFSPDYAAPEQVSYGRTGPFTDVHALALMLTELLTGQPPYGVGAPEQRFEAAVAERRPTPAAAGVSAAGWEPVLARALARRPADRYPDADALLAALEGAQAAPSPVTPGARAPSPRRWVALALAALAGAAAIAGVGWRIGSRRASNAAGDRIMLAVLPFENLTGDRQQDYFSDGLTEGMISQLSRLSPERLGVIGRTSVMQYKGTRKSVRAIGQELGVGYLLECSVTRAGNRVRIDARLLATTNQTQLWADSYDRQLEDVMTLQNEVAQAIAVKVRLTLSAERKAQLARVRPVSPAAYDAYLRGRHLLENDNFNEARPYFEQATQLDPSYAAAYAGLAEVYDSALKGPAPPDTLAKGKAAAVRALELDEQLPEAHAVLGSLLGRHEWNWALSGRHLRRAVDLDPNSADAHYRYAGYLSSVGRLADAVIEFKRGVELNPFSVRMNIALASAYYHNRRYDEAIAQSRRTLELDPQYQRAHLRIALSYVEMGRYEQALAAATQAGNYRMWIEASVHARAGRKQEAASILATVISDGQRNAAEIAQIYAALGRHDDAFRWLEKALNGNRFHLMGLRSNQAWDPLRSDPRFAEVVRRVGAPDLSGTSP